MFEDAIEHFCLLDSNPVRKKYRPKVKQKERKFLRPDEAHTLLEAVADRWIGPAVWICLLSGLRCGEVQALRVKDLDFFNKVIWIRGTYNRKTKSLQDHPKQGDDGKVPMPQVLADYLQTKIDGKLLNDFVVSGERTKMLNYDSFLKCLKRICEEIGVTEISTHELRHSCTELWIKAGASAEDIRRLLNQKSLNVTRRYIHRTDDRLNHLASNLLVNSDSDNASAQKPTPLFK